MLNYSWWTSFTLFVVSLIVTSHPLRAQDEFEEVRVLDAPRYSLTKKVTIDAEFGILPLDAYYKPIVFEGAVSYQFTDYFTWEVARFGISLINIDTGLRSSVERAAQSVGAQFAETSDQALEDFTFRGGSLLYLNMLYSKSNWFNEAIAYHYWQLGIGGMYYKMGSKNQFAAELALRVRFFLTDMVVANLRFGHSIGFSSSAPMQHTSVNLGVGLGI